MALVTSAEQSNKSILRDTNIDNQKLTITCHPTAYTD